MIYPNWNHPAVKRVVVVLLIIGAAATGWYLVTRLLPAKAPQYTQNEKRADSLAATKPAEVALIDSSNARIAARNVETARIEANAKASQDRALKERARADGLALAAVQASDKAKAWKDAYEERTNEASDLRITLAQSDLIITNLKKDTTDLRFQLRVLNTRLKTTEDVNVGLRDDLEKARRCRILGTIPCPSRIQTAALTLLAVEGVQLYQSQRRR